MTASTSLTHILGFPRMGAQRELKFALEQHWRGETDAAALEQAGVSLRARHWQLQQEAGLAWVTVGDFAYYDHVAHLVQLLGLRAGALRFRRVPARTAALLHHGARCRCRPTLPAAPVARTAAMPPAPATRRWR